MVGLATAAVVVGQAGAALAAPTAPTAEVAISQSLAPLLHGASHGASGTETLHFFTRTAGSSTWNLLNDVPAAGPDAYTRLPSGKLAIGDGFEFQVKDCDGGGCTSSAMQTGHVSPALGAGARPGATRVPFAIGDRLAAQVDVGSGNLLLTTTQFSLPRRSGRALDVGLAYNSVTRLSYADFSGSVAPGWRLSTGSDIRLRPKAQGAFVYYGPNGMTGTFFPDGHGGYTPPPGVKMTLAADGGGWKLTNHGTGEVQHFDGGGQLLTITDRSGNATTFDYAGPDVLTAIHAHQGGTAGALSVATVGGGSAQITGIAQTADDYDQTTRSVSFGYDPATGFLTSITDTLGRVTSFSYGAYNNLNSITAPGEATTSFTYDTDGRVQTITQPTADPAVSAVTRFAYPTGRQTLLAGPNSDQGQSVADAAHTTYDLTGDGMLLVASATDPAGTRRSATYTPFLDVASSTDPANQTTSFGHAANGGESLTGVTAPTGATASATYGTGAAQYQPATGTDAQPGSTVDLGRSGRVLN